MSNKTASDAARALVRHGRWDKKTKAERLAEGQRLTRARLAKRAAQEDKAGNQEEEACSSSKS